jgi:nucleoid DNA-binding protein
MMDLLDKTVTKYIFLEIVANKLKNKYTHAVIGDIFCLFLDELQTEIVQNKDVEITNFGKFEISDEKKLKKLAGFNNKIMEFTIKRKAKFRLHQALSKEIRKHLDVDKTFPSD